METPLMLGTFKFATTTASFAELQRSTEWNWAEQARVGNTPAVQFVGYGADTITLPVVIYPGQYGREAAALTLRKMADAGKPYILMDGRGYAHGEWVIKSIAETQSAFLDNGIPRKIDFTIILLRYATREQAGERIAAEVAATAARMAADIKKRFSF